MEFDFHQIKVFIDEKECVYHQATISFPKSNHIVAYLFKDEKFTSIMTALINAFKEIGGVPETVVFDNLRPVVSKFLFNNKKEYSKNITKLAGFFGFKIFTCNPYSGNEKGHVENSGKVTRRNFFSLNYKFKNEEELYSYFQTRLNEHNQATIDVWNVEKSFLHKLPKQEYIIAEFGEAIVNPYSTICVNRNYYSVDEHYAGKKVNYSIIDGCINISSDNKAIGKHILLEGHDQYAIDINHYLETFLKKPAALINSLALKQAKKELKDIFEKQYSSDPRGFILSLMGKNNNKDANTVEQASLKQLNTISSIFDQA